MSGEVESGQLLRRARQAVGWSQAELALAAGVGQSVVSAYENGHRQPSVPTLRRLIEATGTRLTIDIVQPPALPDTERGRLLQRHRSRLRAVAGRYGAAGLRVFGSVARGEDGVASDVDIAVDLPAAPSLVQLAALERELTDVLGVPVDMVPLASLRPEIGERVLVEGIPLVIDRDARRLDDVLAAAAAIEEHLLRGSLSDGLVFDAVRMRLIEIGEAVKDISDVTRARESAIPWRDIAGMRDHLTHRYFDTNHAIVAATVEQDLAPLVAAVRRRLRDHQ